MFPRMICELLVVVMRLQHDLISSIGTLNIRYIQFELFYRGEIF